jgi:hypothetical protein
VSGTTRLENEGGAWLGQYRGVILPDGSATYGATYVGPPLGAWDQPRRYRPTTLPSSATRTR